MNKLVSVTSVLLKVLLLTNAQNICKVTLPNNLLSAKGLSTPFILDGCDQKVNEQQVFVQGGIITPKNEIFIYNPLIINRGQRFVPPVIPNIPDGSTIALWFGTNGNTVQLENTQGLCVNGFQDSLFGQMAYCNAQNFFAKANNVISPPLGTAKDGQICPTTLSFSVVDQDPDDNVNTIYLLTPNGTIMQDTKQNRKQNPTLTELINASDETLLANFINTALNCKPFLAQDLADPGTLKPALFLNEISARQHQQPPKAFIPALDPMVLVDGNPNLQKLNLYRIGVDQDPVTDLCQASTNIFCKELLNNGVPRLAAQKSIFVGQPSPNTAVANSLFTFLASRINTTWSQENGLGCVQLLNIPAPVKLKVTNGVVTDAEYILPATQNSTRFRH
jgi:hypothetical protein